jgi:hypothetical protein
MMRLIQQLAPRHLTLAFALCLSPSLQAQTASPSIEGYTRVDFSLPAEVERLLIVDADRDGLADILSVAKEQIGLYFQRSAGDFDFSSPDTSITLTGRSVGWELSENYQDENGANSFSLLALVDGNKVQQWRIENRQFSAPTDLLTGLSGFAGSGVNRLHFSRDINDDGRDDLIIPGAGTLQLFIRNTDGSYQQAISVLSDMQIFSNLYVRQNLERDVGQTLTIPLIELRDVNNDNRPDLISETEERFDVSLANASGDYFPQSPSFSIDREEIRERLGNFDVDQLDFANLTGILALTHEEILEDVDGDQIDDFVLREGGKVSLFTGNANGMDFAQPKQVLRSGGNVLKVFLHDEDGDGRKDLWLWRIEPISVGDLFLWLAISGSVNVEAFVYRNEGESFARRPARQVTVALKFPSAVRMISSVVDIREQARAVENSATIPTAVANISGVGNALDLIVLLDEQVQIFHNSIAPIPPLADDRFLASLNYTRSRNDYEIDVRRIIDEFEIAQNKELRTVEGRAPDQSFALQQAMRNGDLMSVKLNADERDDLFVFLERGKERITGIVLLSTD